MRSFTEMYDDLDMEDKGQRVSRKFLFSSLIDWMDGGTIPLTENYGRERILVGRS